MSHSSSQILYVSGFQDLISVPFEGNMNAICWSRTLGGNFAEIIAKAATHENITVLNEETLIDLQLTEAGQTARDILLQDFNLLKAHGASPVINIINYYDKDDALPFFPTDVYSYHVDRSPIPADTFLCTYHGESSDIIPNEQAVQKILIPEIRDQLKEIYTGEEDDFESFLTEHFFDLHYQAQQNANNISLGIGNLWRLAVDHPGSKVPPCIHRAPIEKNGVPRLLLIC